MTRREWDGYDGESGKQRSLPGSATNWLTGELGRI